MSTHRYGDTSRVVRVHMSAAEVTQVRDTVQDHGASSKPRGFWYGVGRSWLDWVDGEMPDWRRPCLQQVILDPSKVLFLRTPEQIRAFGKAYGAAIRPGEPTDYIAWDRVAADFKGIEIAPYQWSLRMSDDVPWYYVWDVASGCVWDGSVVRELKVLQEAELSEEGDES